MAASGAPWTLGGLAAVLEAAGPVPVHMDGARLFNAEAATGVTTARWAAGVTTVMCCLSKGLCAPVGSLLAGAQGVIEAARLARKRLGGGMRQAGVLAAPGLVALRDMTERLPEDHRRAARLAEGGGEPLARLRPRPRDRTDEHRDLRPRRARQAAGAPRGPGRPGARDRARGGALRDPSRRRRQGDRAGPRRTVRRTGICGAVKVRIGISAGGESLGPEQMLALGRSIGDVGIRFALAA